MQPAPPEKSSQNPGQRPVRAVRASSLRRYPKGGRERVAPGFQVNLNLPRSARRNRMSEPTSATKDGRSPTP